METITPIRAPDAAWAKEGRYVSLIRPAWKRVVDRMVDRVRRGEPGERLWETNGATNHAGETT
jgi:hypothetical protein